ncbi:hypothetical protein SCCGRSA3_00158, partial [Marine Group I thaumarchaeote SCGC RSA3]
KINFVTSFMKIGCMKYFPEPGTMILFFLIDFFRYFVGLGDTQEEAFEAYLKKVSGVAGAVTVADEDYVELDRDDRIEIIKKVFEENEITVSEPTSIQIPLSFNEGELFFFTENDREETIEFLSQFIDDFVKPRSDRVFMWQEENNLNIGTIYVKDGISEIHYVSIEVGT